MATALILGGASCLHDDIREALSLGAFDIVVACNDAIPEWEGRLDAAVSLHQEKLHEWQAARRDRGYSDPVEWFCPRVTNATKVAATATIHLFPGQSGSGSSGLYAAKVALMDLGRHRAVLCGVPMTHTPHVYGGAPWGSSARYLVEWKRLPIEWAARMRSMSGKTAGILGSPTAEWINGSDG